MLRSGLRKLASLRVATYVTLVLALTLSITSAKADPVSDWNKIMNDTVLAGGTNPLFTSRVVAVVAASVFDAVNGTERRYSPIHVDPAAPRGASGRAAAVQAAYATLVALYPEQKSALDAKREASLGALTDDGDHPEDSVSIARGIRWGQLLRSS
jgi:hypothetical protein